MSLITFDVGEWYEHLDSDSPRQLWGRDPSAQLFTHAIYPGANPVQDLTHNLPATMTGGVGGAWTEESNWQTLLGAKAPVIAEATDNLLSDDDASFEAGINRYAGTSATLAVSTAWSWHGVNSLRVLRNDANADRGAYRDVKAITAASTQYTLSVRFKADTTADGNNIACSLYGDTSGDTWGANVVADSTQPYQVCRVTKTFAAGDTTTRWIRVSQRNGAANDIIYIDAIQLEQKAYATPFALNSRTASTMTFPTATLGMGVGPTTYVIALEAPWSGADGILHYLFDAGSIELYKSAANNLTLEITDAGAGTKTMAGAVTAVNMPANTTHIIIAKHDGAGTLSLKLNNTALVVAAGAGTGIPAALNANLYCGTNTASGNHANAAQLLAVYNRWTSDNEDTLLQSASNWRLPIRRIA